MRRCCNEVARGYNANCSEEWMKANDMILIVRIQSECIHSDLSVAGLASWFIGSS